MARRTHTASCRSIFCLALVAAVLAVPRHASAAQDQSLYFVCEVATRGVNPGTIYVSDVTGPFGVMLNNKAVSIALTEEFRRAVTDKDTLNSSAVCSRFDAEDKARDFLKQKAAKPPTAMRVAETHWKHGAAATVATASPATPAPVQAPQSAKPGAGGPAFHGFCSANFPGSIGYNKAKPTYFTPIFGFPNDGNYGAWFGEYVAKKYSFQPWPAASCKRQSVSIDMGGYLQADMAKAKDLGAPSVVQTEWTSDTHQALMADLAKNATPKPTPAPAPAAKKPGSDDDAPPAAKPAAAPAITKSPTTSAPTAKPAPQAPPLYSYCYAYGMPAGRPSGPVKQHFYITQVFQLAISDRPNQAFQSFLHDAHPGENINASCSGPVPFDAAQKNRQTVFDLRKRQSSSYDVVEVDWKFVR
jgi:hypothetical protein